MFKFFSARLDSKADNALIYKQMGRPRPKTLLATSLAAILMLSGCQQQAAEESIPDKTKTSEQTRFEDSEPMAQSESTSARIEQFKPLYVAQYQGLQGRLQAEYESLQAADSSDTANALLINGVEETASNQVSAVNDQPINGNQVSTADTLQSAENTTSSSSNSTPNNSTTGNSIPSNNTTSNETVTNKPANSEPVPATNKDTDINTSTEVGERDLTVLKRISLEPRKPVILTEEQITEHYEQAMKALYQPVSTPLSAEDTNTLINIATLTPQLFEDAEIAGRVSAKSPALARLIIQHQVWEQIAAQQVLDMQQMKQNQQQEFETLMAKFNETIEGYDEQIAKYEQTLKEFQ